ncbi:MAG: MFS transporter [Planctomycetia bacterium]|nr:MFS transporter [Planctomycetia bacterium]
MLAANDPSVLRWRLSLLMFLQYAPAGAVLPMFTRHLKELQFTPVEIGLACATQSLAGLLATSFAGQLADRWVATERCLAVFSFAASVLLWLLADLTTFPAVFALSLVFWLLMVPVLTLGTSLCFHHLAAAGSGFGPVRMWGTVGWVAAVWLLSGWLDNPTALELLRVRLRPSDPDARLADMFRLAAALTFVLGLYSLTLPHTPPSRGGAHWLAPLAALKLLRRRSFAVYLAITLGIVATIPFSSQLTPLLLNREGVPDTWLARTLTIAQSTEIIVLAVLPWLMERLGDRTTMLVGLVGWTLGLGALTIGEPVLLVAGSLTMNGLCIGCYVVAGQVFINRQAPADIRASVQGLFAITTGLGNLIGNILVGKVHAWADEAFTPTFAVACATAAVLTCVFLVGFDSSEAPSGELVRS